MQPKYASIGEWQDMARKHREEFKVVTGWNPDHFSFDYRGQYDMWFYVDVIEKMHSFVLGDGEYDEEMSKI